MWEGILAGVMEPHAAEIHGKADQIIDLLAEIKQGVQASPEDLTQKTQRRMTNAAQGTGAVLVDLGMVPPGTSWRITRLSLQGGPATGVRVWLDTITDGTLIDKVTTDAVGDYADTVGENPHVREGRRVIAEFIGQPANQLCRVWLQVDQFQEIPRRNIR